MKEAKQWRRNAERINLSPYLLGFLVHVPCVFRKGFSKDLT
jgi:hypothetical protein